MARVVWPLWALAALASCPACRRDPPAPRACRAVNEPLAVVSGGLRESSSAPALVWDGSAFGAAWAENRERDGRFVFTRLDRALQPLGARVEGPWFGSGVSTPALAWSGTMYGLLWVGHDEAGGSIHFERFDAEGRTAGPAIILDGGSGDSRPRLAWDGARFVVVLDDARTLVVRFVSPDGVVIDPGADYLIAPLPEAVELDGVALAGNGRGFGLVWLEAAGQRHQVRFASFDAAGRALGAPVLVREARTPARLGPPALAWNGSAWRLGWLIGSGKPPAFAIQLARVDSTRVRLGAPQPAGRGTSAWRESWELAFGEGGDAPILVWAATDDAGVERLWAAVSPDGLEVVPSGSRETGPIRLGPGSSLVWDGSSWAGGLGFDGEAAVVRLSSATSPPGPAVCLTDHERLTGRPAIASAGDGSYVAAWGDALCGRPVVRFARLAADGTRVGKSVTAADGPSSVTATALARGDGGYGLAWVSEAKGEPSVLGFAALDAQGRAIGAQQVVRDGVIRLGPSSVGWSGAGYGLAWGEKDVPVPGAAPAGARACFARFEASGRPAGPVVVLAPQDGDPAFDEVTNAAAVWVGDQWVVGWNELHDIPHRGGVPRLRLARLDASGRVLDRRTLDDDAGAPAVVALSDGFAVGWRSAMSSEQLHGAWLVRFASDGTERGAPVMIAESEVVDNGGLALAPASDGMLLAAWTGPSSDESGPGDLAYDYFVAEIDPTGRRRVAPTSWTSVFGAMNPMQLVPSGLGHGLFWFQIESQAKCCSEDDPRTGRFVALECR
jgi:hypothetical protein